MNNTFKDLLIFAAGVGVGYLVTRKLLKDKYEQKYHEEVESTKEAYRKRCGLDKNDEEEADGEPELPGIDTYKKVLKEEDYFDYSGATGSVEVEKEQKEIVVDRPYVISPEEFGEYDDYEKISLTYYADQKLADEEDELVDDVDEIVGEDSLTHFGEYEDDSVFVRNDARKCDYEILLDQRNYYDVIKSKPHRSMED